MAGTSTTRGAPPPMAAGGTTGQVLTKASNASYDTEWTTVGGGGGGTVTDVTASAPLSSTGGATPDISIGGGTAGQVLTSNGASAPTFENLPAPPTVPSASSSNGTSIGTAAPGVSTDYARGDHVHDGSLSDLDDVSATVPTAGQVLAWGGAEWAPATPAAVPAASNSTPAGLGTAAVGVSTAYARADHVHAGTVTALTDRYEELPAQTFSEFAHASAIAASPTRDIQTALNAIPSGAAHQVIVGPGSYAGATVTIPVNRSNVAIIGPTAGDFGGTVASLSSGRGLTIGNNAQRIRVVALQVEGLTTVSTTGSGVHRFERCQLEGGLSIGAISQTVYVVGCTLGNVTINAGFTGALIIDRCTFGGTYTNNTGNPAKVFISDSAGLASAPTAEVFVPPLVNTGAAYLNGRFQLSTGSTTYYADGTALLKAPLTAINGLTPAADRIAYYTSASAASMTAITAFGRSLIDDVDAAAARTTLGLGTAATSAASAFQAADATLTALAGVTTAANKLAYFTGVDTAAATDITTAGREILSTATSGAAGQVLTSSGGGAPTWTTVSGGGSGYAADAWDLSWQTSMGAPSANGWTITGGTETAATVDTVACYEFVPTTVNSLMQRDDLSALNANFEMRAWIRMPAEGAAASGDYNIISYYTGATLNKTIQVVLNNSGLSLNVTGTTLTAFTILAGSLDQQWVSITIRVIMPGTATVGAVHAWVGEMYMGSIQTASISQPTGSPNGRIRIGQGENGAGTNPAWQIAFFGFRSGFNQAPPSYTYRGEGYGSYGPA